MFGVTELVRRKLLNQLEIICCIYTPYLVWRANIWYGKPKVGSVVVGHPEMVTARGSLISHEIVSRSHLTIQQCVTTAQFEVLTLITTRNFRCQQLCSQQCCTYVTASEQPHIEIPSPPFPISHSGWGVKRLETDVFFT